MPYDVAYTMQQGSVLVSAALGLVLGELTDAAAIGVFGAACIALIAGTALVAEAVE